MRLRFFAPVLFLAAFNAAADPLEDMSVVNGESLCGWHDTPSAEYTVRSDDPDFTLPDTSGQKVLSVDKTENGAEVRVVCAGRETGEDSGGGKYTARTRFLNTENVEVRLFASKIIGSKHPVRAAEKEVNAAITDKNQGIPLITVDEILRVRSGDCTEHTVLLCSILRAAAIPSRAVVGLVYVPEWQGKKNVFVFHMWAEAYVRGKWILADASFPKKKSHVRYIALSYHTLKTAMPLEYLAAVSHVKNLKITRVR